MLTRGEEVCVKLKRINNFVPVIVFALTFLLFTTSAFALQLGDRNLSLNSRGEDVRQLQQELSKLNYNVGPIDGMFGPMTQRAVVSFQGDNNVPTTGLFGPLSLAALRQVTSRSNSTYTVVRGDMLWSIAQRHNVTVDEIVRANNLSNPNNIFVGQVLTIPNGSGATTPAPAPTPAPVQQRGAVATPWAQVNPMWARGTTATVIDVQTGLSFTVRRFGGSNHSDVEPLTTADRNTMFQIYNSQWSWSRRPIVVIINGQRIAASMNGMPHGGGAISNNNFGGHFCIHFLNSRTHGTGVVDAAHQNAVQRAVGQ